MKIGIIRCQENSERCPGPHCFQAIREKSGEFKRYDSVELIGFDTCGGCGRNEANKIVTRALRLKQLGAEVIHLGVCMIYACPFREIYEKGIIEKVGLPVVRGTHPHVPPWDLNAHQVTYPNNSWAGAQHMRH
jgi:predicted metal-binding protein